MSHIIIATSMLTIRRILIKSPHTHPEYRVMGGGVSKLKAPATPSDPTPADSGKSSLTKASSSRWLTAGHSVLACRELKKLLRRQEDDYFVAYEDSRQDPEWKDYRKFAWKDPPGRGQKAMERAAQQDVLVRHPDFNPNMLHQGMSLLMVAAAHHAYTVCEHLLENCAADPNIRDADGRTALHHAAISQRFQRWGIDSQGRQLVLSSYYKGYAKMTVKALFRHGGLDPCLYDAEGHTPYMAAKAQRALAPMTLTSLSGKRTVVTIQSRKASHSAEETPELDEALVLLEPRVPFEAIAAALTEPSVARRARALWALVPEGFGVASLRLADLLFAEAVPGPEPPTGTPPTGIVPGGLPIEATAGVEPPFGIIDAAAVYRARHELLWRCIFEPMLNDASGRRALSPHEWVVLRYCWGASAGPTRLHGWVSSIWRDESVCQAMEKHLAQSAR